MIFKIVFFYALASEIILRIWSHQRSLEANPDYLILLGHKGGAESPVTRDRFLNALEAIRKWPQAQLIVTGNECKGEVSAFKMMFAQAGISNFLIEDKSQTTWGNFKNILPQLKSKNVLVITSEYHQRRSLLIARAYGLRARSFGKDTQIYKNSMKLFLKERLALWYSLPKAFYVRFISKQ